MSLIKLALNRVYTHTQRVAEMLAKSKPIVKGSSKIIPLADKLTEAMKSIV